MTINTTTPPGARSGATGLPANNTVIAAGANVTATVTFSPTTATASNGSLGVTSNGGNATINLTGTGTTVLAPVLSVTPNPVAFGNVTVNTTGSQTVTIANTGNAALTINTTTPPGAPFGATGLPANNTVIAAGANVTATLTFSPTTATASNGSLGVTSNGGNATINLTGTGTSGAVIGYNQVGSQLDSGDMNYMNGSRFTTGSTAQTISSMSVYIKSVVAAPNNKYQLAVYADVNGSPGALVAATATGTLTPNSWNSLPIGATLTANTAYWFMYNTNGDNNMSFDTGAVNQGGYSTNPQTFGTWPAAFGTAVRTTTKFSIYAT